MGFLVSVSLFTLHYLFFFNAFHTIVLKFNLLRYPQTQQIIGHRLQGVLYKIQQDDMFWST